MTSNDNLILNLKLKENTNFNIVPFDGEITSEFNVNSYSVCWNCCHEFENVPIYLPHKFKDGIFYVSGHFCSYECCKRYIVDNTTSYELWNKISLLHQIKLTSLDDDSDIKIAPNKLCLQMFGGSYTIEEYRKNNIDNHDIIVPPIVPISDFEYTFESLNKKSHNSDNTFRLSRKKPIKKNNNIYDTMNLNK